MPTLQEMIDTWVNSTSSPGIYGFATLFLIFFSFARRGLARILELPFARTHIATWGLILHVTTGASSMFYFSLILIFTLLFDLWDWRKARRAQAGAPPAPAGPD